MSFLKQFDLFGQSPVLSFRKEVLYRTQLGGLISIAIVAFVLSFFYSNIIDFFQLTQIVSKEQLIHNVDPGKLSLNSSKYMFAVQIEQTNFIQNPFFNITVEQKHYFRENNTVSKNTIFSIELVPCTIDHFQPIYNQFGYNATNAFLQNGLSDFLCPSQNSQELILQGLYTSKDFYLLKFGVSGCQNNTLGKWQPVCKGSDQQQQVLSQIGYFRFRLLSVNYIFNPDQNKDDIIPFIDNELFFNFVPTQFTQADIFYRQRNVSTDTGIMMVPNINTQIFPARDAGDFRQQISFSQSVNDQEYAAFYPQLSQYQYQIHREYQKLDQFLSYMGGFLQFVILASGLFVRFYNQQHMIVEMANDLFGYCVIDGNQQNKKQKRQFLWNQVHHYDKVKKTYVNFVTAFQKSPKIENQTPVQHQSLQIDTHKLTIYNRFKRLKSRYLQFFDKFKTVTYFSEKRALNLEYLLAQFIGNRSFFSDHTKLLLKATKQISNELDIEFILKQLYEIEKLKQVLFLRDQIKLFNFSQKQIIVLDKGKQRNRNQVDKHQDLHLEPKTRKLRRQYCNLINAYKRMKCLNISAMSDEQQRINQGLFSLLGKEIPNLIDEEIEKYKQDEIEKDQEQQDINILNRNGTENQVILPMTEKNEEDRQINQDDIQ
ncbi:hypothetical protein pb186bvf_016846 [Paramecium bursaria]